MNIAAGDLEAALKKKGFLLERSTTDKLFFFYYKGRKTQIHTKISHGRGETLRDKLCAAVKKQMCFETSRQLSDFVECSLDQDDYINLLKDKRIIAD